MIEKVINNATRKTFFLTIIFLSAVFYNNCSSFGRFGSAPFSGSTSGSEYQKSYTILGASEGQSSAFRFLNVATVTKEPSVEEAVREAIDNLSGDALINITWYLERKIYIIGRVDIIHINGQVIKYTR